MAAVSAPDQRGELALQRSPVILPAAKRFALFAMLAWTWDYGIIINAERSMHDVLVHEMAAEWTSGYMRRGMNGADHEQATAKIMDRMNDIAGNLDRSRNVHFIPFSQAVKGVSYLYSVVPGNQWARERALRRIVGRQWAKELLEHMADCRPPPPFEQSNWLWSIAFDQTYVRKAGGTTGTTRYRPVQTVDEDGELCEPERMTYINGQDYPAPAFGLSAQAYAAIFTHGPYTQDFHRVLPALQPDRIDGFMDDLLERTAGILNAAALQAGGRVAAFTTLDFVRALLSRPNHDPGGPTYMTFLPALLNCDTKSYIDMMRIIAWMESYVGGEPLVLHVIGDGQSLLRMRDLKRLFPDSFKHVLISNGHFHSSAHFQFAVCRMWWLSLMCVCCALLGKDKVGPNIKNLEENSARHSLEAIQAITVAIIVYLVVHVKHPPPDLFLSNPIAYMALIEHAGGSVLLEFLRHAGLP